jgi:Uma2 family endonuclease
MTWKEACEDKSLANLPYKVELDRQGKLIMSPTRNKHAFYQGRLAFLLQSLLPHGFSLTECAVETKGEGTIVADVTWASPERFAVIKEELSCSVAPEICVEVWSESNTAQELNRKRRLYLANGALEFWYCDKQGNLTFYDSHGQIPASSLCPNFPASAER